MTKKQEQLMICPKAKECIGECPNPFHQTPHKYQYGLNDRCDDIGGGCPACIPYVEPATCPEKERRINLTLVIKGDTITIE